MVRWTCSWFWAFVVLILLLTGIGGPFFKLAQFGGDDWTIGEHITSVDKDAINNAKSQVDQSVNKKKNLRGKRSGENCLLCVKLIVVVSFFSRT